VKDKEIKLSFLLKFAFEASRAASSLAKFPFRLRSRTSHVMVAVPRTTMELNRFHSFWEVRNYMIKNKSDIKNLVPN
jgi:hypothetical protein